MVQHSISEETFLEEQEQIFIYLQQGNVKKAERQIERCKFHFHDTLFLTKRLIKQGKSYVSKKKEEHRRFVVETEEEMSLQCIAVSEVFQKCHYHTKHIEEQYQRLLEQWLEPEDNLLYWNLLLSCKTLSAEKQEELNAFLEEQTKTYKEAVRSFWWKSKSLMQTLFNCYCYFKNPEAEKLLIANCTVEELAEVKYQKALMRYLETVNHKLYKKDRIQKAILPNIEAKEKNTNPIRQRFYVGKSENNRYVTNTLKVARVLQDILHQYEIQTCLAMCDEGEPLGYLLTGIDVSKEVPESKNITENKLRNLTVWLNEWKFQGEW